MKVTVKDKTGEIKAVFEDIAQFAVDTNVETGLIYEISDVSAKKILIPKGKIDRKQIEKLWPKGSPLQKLPPGKFI